MSAQWPPPGWYPNPSGRPGQRYWDGRNWTEHRTGTPPKSSAGWYPDPSGARGQRYFDGNDWTEHRAGLPRWPAPSPPTGLPQTPQRRIPPWVWVAFAAAAVVVLIIGGMLVSHKGSRSISTRKSTTISGTPTQSSTTAATTSAPPPAGPPLHSQVVPELVLPAGSTRDYSPPGQPLPSPLNNSVSEIAVEVWTVPRDVASEAADVRSQLPINRPYDGLPWCADDSNPKLQLSQWDWGTAEDFVMVAVTPNVLPSGAHGPGSEVHVSRGPDTVGCH